MSGSIILPASVDVSSLDTRLLGRVKLLDSGGAVIDPAKEHSTAANPGSTRLSDGASYLGSTAQRLHVADGGVPVGVSAAAASPVGVRLSDGAAFVDARDPIDRDARLLGRAKNLDSAGAVIDPALKGQLPAALVGGRVDVNIGAPATLPVSIATNTPDVTDRAAREVGRARIWDGTDEATVLPVRTQPSGTAEKALVVNDLPNRLPTYGVTIATQTPAITVGVKNLLDIWHPNTITQDAYIVELWATALVTTASTAGRTAVRVSTITAAPTGGTNLTSADIGGAGASAFGTAGNLMQVKTGGGTVGATFIRRLVEWTTNTVGRIDIPIFSASNPGNGIILRGGAAAGICVDIEREVAHTALVDVWTVGARWLEL